MKSWLESFLLAAFSLMPYLCSSSMAQALDLTGGSCRPRAAVEASEREPYESAGLHFVSLIVRGNFAEAETGLSSALSKYVSVEKLQAGMQPSIADFQSLGPLSIQRSYLVQTIFMTGNGQPVICPLDATSSSNSIEEKVFVAAEPLPKQAYVMVQGRTAKGIWTFTLWMVPEAGSWQVNGFHSAAPPSLSISTLQLRDRAREQVKKGHNFNALVTYIAGSELAYRGPNLQLGIWLEMQNEARAIKLPAELQGAPPFTWQLGNNVFHVLAVFPVADDGELGLGIRYRAVPSETRKQIEDQSRLLIQELKKLHPDYLDGFKSVVVDADGPKGNPVHLVEKAY